MQTTNKTKDVFLTQTQFDTLKNANNLETGVIYYIIKENPTSTNMTFEELVKVTPTDINVDSTGALILEHDGVEISNQKKALKFKTLFGDMTLYGEGNIDLYRHFITLNDTTYLEYLSSNNLTADSLQDLTTLTKAKNGTKIRISENNYIEYTTVWKFKDGTLITKVTDDVTTA